LRALEIEAEVLLKGTRVDGVYSADPERDPNARLFSSIHGREVIRHDLKVMDMTAFTLCREAGLPIVVFNMNKQGNLLRVVCGEPVGTLVYWTETPPAFAEVAQA
jgi:uridylate kinase